MTIEVDPGLAQQATVLAVEDSLQTRADNDAQVDSERPPEMEVGRLEAQVQREEAEHTHNGKEVEQIPAELSLA